MRELAIVCVVAACSVPSRSEHVRTSSTAYRDPDMWLCRPDLPTDACRIDMTTTELGADGTRAVASHHSAVDAPIDCFYVYPTVDLNLIPGNHVDFSDTAKMAKAAAAQIARFTEVCNVYAPLYRQATIATYVSSKGDQRHFFDVAYSDIAAAFHEYLQHFDRGRPIVIIGHSQGSQMAAHLLKDTFDQSDELRPRLLVAMTIGFSVEVPDGADTGGTFQHLAPCKGPDQTSCVIAYRTIAEGDTPSSIGEAPPGHHVLCVDPSDHALLSESVFRSKDGIKTPFTSVRELYRAHCITDARGHGFLAIAEARVPGDQRPSLIDLGSSHGGIGLHVYDIQVAQGDLVELIRHKARTGRPATTMIR
jgi:pimeloyl-ACP methyl ester carboxylesterase